MMIIKNSAPEQKQLQPLQVSVGRDDEEETCEQNSLDPSEEEEIQTRTSNTTGNTTSTTTTTMRNQQQISRNVFSNHRCLICFKLLTDYKGSKLTEFYSLSQTSLVNSKESVGDLLSRVLLGGQIRPSRSSMVCGKCCDYVRTVDGHLTQVSQMRERLHVKLKRSHRLFNAKSLSKANVSMSAGSTAGLFKRKRLNRSKFCARKNGTLDEEEMKTNEVIQTNRTSEGQANVSDQLNALNNLLKSDLLVAFKDKLMEFQQQQQQQQKICINTNNLPLFASSPIISPQMNSLVAAAASFTLNNGNNKGQIHRNQQQQHTQLTIQGQNEQVAASSSASPSSNRSKRKSNNPSRLLKPNTMNSNLQNKEDSGQLQQALPKLAAAMKQYQNGIINAPGRSSNELNENKNLIKSEHIMQEEKRASNRASNQNVRLTSTNKNNLKVVNNIDKSQPQPRKQLGRNTFVSGGIKVTSTIKSEFSNKENDNFKIRNNELLNGKSAKKRVNAAKPTEQDEIGGEQVEFMNEQIEQENEDYEEEEEEEELMNEGVYLDQNGEQDDQVDGTYGDEEEDDVSHYNDGINDEDEEGFNDEDFEQQNVKYSGGNLICRQENGASNKSLKARNENYFNDETMTKLIQFNHAKSSTNNNSGLGNNNNKNSNNTSIPKSNSISGGGGATKHSCTICKKTFKTQNILRQHMRIHTGDKPFTCEICQKAFSQMASLKYHLATHSDDRPFRCDNCAKTFKLKPPFKKHIKECQPRGQLNGNIGANGNSSSNQAFYNNSNYNSNGLNVDMNEEEEDQI